MAAAANVPHPLPPLVVDIVANRFRALGEPMRIPSILFSYARSAARIGWGEGMLTTLLIVAVLALVGTFALGWMLLPRSATSTDVATPTPHHGHQ